MHRLIPASTDSLQDKKHNWRQAACLATRSHEMSAGPLADVPVTCFPRCMHMVVPSDRTSVALVTFNPDLPTAP